ADFPNLWPTPFPGTNRVYRGAGRPSRLVLPVVPTRDGRDEAVLAPAPGGAAPYRLSPDERPWELVQDVLGDRTGLRTLTRGVRVPHPSTRITEEARLELWASNRDPADVTATGKHHRRIVRRDGVTAVDTTCVVRSTATAFHVTIDLRVA